MFDGLSILLASGGIFVTLQFQELNRLVSNDQFCLILQAKAVPVFGLFEGGIRLF